MKKVFLFFYLTLSFLAFGQGTIDGTILDSDDSYPFPNVQVSVVKDGNIIEETESDFYGSFTVKNLVSGNYSIILRFIGMSDKTISNIIVNDSEIKYLMITYPGPCGNSKKICPNNHTDKIIPIIYGFPSMKMERKAKKGKIKLGGCIQMCEAWHCKIHNIDFQ